MANLSEIFQQLFQTNQYNAEIISSIVTFLIVGFAGWLSYFVFERYFSKWALKTETTLDDDILKATKSFVVIFIILIGINYAVSPLPFLQAYDSELAAIFLVLEIVLGAFAVTRVSNIIADWHASRSIGVGGGVKNSHHLMFILKKIIQLVVYIFAFIIILYVFKVDLTGAVVGLGVGGIAIAFAIQNQLGDVLGAFSIYFDRPFEIGDFITVGDYSGTVRNIGVKSTRIQLLQGEELVISNKDLTSSSVRNFRKLEKRRVTFTIGVAYETPTIKLKKISQIISGIMEKEHLAQLERVNFTEFGDYSLKFLVIYHVNSSDYGKYLDIQQSINFAIKESFEAEGIEIAFPTSAIYLKK